MAYTTSNKVRAIKPVALSELENVQGAYWGHPGQRGGRGGGYTERRLAQTPSNDLLGVCTWWSLHKAELNLFNRSIVTETRGE